MLETSSSAHYTFQKLGYVSNSLNFLEKYNLGNSWGVQSNGYESQRESDQADSDIQAGMASLMLRHKDLSVVSSWKDQIGALCNTELLLSTSE